MLTFTPHQDTKKLGVKLKAIYVSGFLFSFHAALLVYIESTFLSQFIQEQLIGVVFTASSILAILSLIWLPSVLSKIGNLRAVIIMVLIEIIALLCLAFLRNIYAILPIFIVHTSLYNTILFNLDIFLESNSEDVSTGKTRGLFLTASNTAYIVPPLIAGFILTDSNYWQVFLIASLFMIPMVILISKVFSNFRDPEYYSAPFWSTLKKIRGRKNIYFILMSNTILSFFFSWMVIYTPLYLHNHIGLEWSSIGIIFTIMLIPFVILDIPLGKLADLFLGEKEMLSAGFIIGAIATFFLSILTSTNLFLWAVILFFTRVGAAIVQIMNETYFFKQIDENDSHIISIYRMTQPIGYAIGPLTATLFLSVIDFRYLFVVLAFIFLYGLRYSLPLDDTK